MLEARFPTKLVKSAKLQVDPVRALRVIQIQANVILALAIVLVGTLMWYGQVKSAVGLHVMAGEFEPPVRVNIDTMVFSGEDNITGTAVSNTPFVTVYGKIKDFGLLFNALPDLSVTIRGTRVSIIPVNGEFAEKVVLQPGQNMIDLVVWWDGMSRHRQHYAVTYLQASSTSSVTVR